MKQRRIRGHKALLFKHVSAMSIVLGLAWRFSAEAANNTQENNVNANVVREQYEWSNIWWDNANDPKLPRVLLIGDSISVGYGPVVAKLLQGKVHVDRLSTSRGINDPVLPKETIMMLEDNHYLAIHFNNGLHGFHLDDATYASGLREYAKLLEMHAPDAKLIWAASTPITKGNDVHALADNNGVVISRNSTAAEVMLKNGIPSNDLYQLVIGKADLRSLDGYHYNAGGYELMGKVITESLLKVIE